MGTVLGTEDRVVNTTDGPALMWSFHVKGGDR